MRKKVFVLFACILLLLKGFSQTEFVPVFESGKDGYKSFRIPAIVSLANGDLLAFCEGRVNGPGDYGNIDLVMKTSKDHGKSWSALKVIAEYGNYQLCNPAPVVDFLDPAYPNGRIFLFYNTGNNHEGEILKGHGIKYCMYITSADGGNTWSAPVDITMQVHRPNQPAVDPKYNFSEDWRYYANTPGHAMQFQEGRYKGRIFIAANHTQGNIPQGQSPYLAHGYYTDDHGKSFKLGNSINLYGSNESMAVELSNSRLMMNSRNQKGDVKARIVSLSSDGGATWDTTYIDKNLVDPVCQGSILNIGKKQKKNILAFCNDEDPRSRNNLTLKISFDEGKSWEKTIPVYTNKSGSSPKFDYSAYSDLVKLGKKKVGILFEKDNYAQIVFKTIEW